MSLADFLRASDPFALTLSLAYGSAYFACFWQRRRVGDLRWLQEQVINSIWRDVNPKTPMHLIDAIHKEDPKILMPLNQGNRLSNAVSAIFALVAPAVILFDPLQKTFPDLFFPSSSASCAVAGSPPHLPSDCFLINADRAYWVFLVFFFVGALLLFFEYRFWNDWSRLKDEYK